MNVHPAYKKSLANLNEPLIMEGFLKEQRNLVSLSSSWNGVTLSVLIDPNSHIVKKALHKDGNFPYVRILMEFFCREIIELPIQEAADHACIIIEEKLRDHSVCAPVPGIVTPENADPIFRYPINLIRALYKQYCDESNYKPTINFHDRQTSEGWLSLNDADRLYKVKEVTNDFLSKLDRQHELEVLGIERDIKLIIRYDDNSGRKNLPQLLMDLENILKGKLEEKLYIELEEVKDVNPIRRI